MNRYSKVYSGLRWMYQPVKSLKIWLQEISYIPKRKMKLSQAAKQEKFRGLHIGCGTFYLSEWFNTDILGTPKIDFPLDITKKLPFSNHFFDAIYGSEVLEHINLEDARLFLQESFRVLKPGGVIRLTTPDMTGVCQVFLGLKKDVDVESFREVWLDGEFSKEIWINSQFRAWGHQHLYTYESLVDELIKVGFSNLNRCHPLETKSCYHQLKNIDYRWYDKVEPKDFACALIVEATKPLK